MTARHGWRRRARAGAAAALLAVLASGATGCGMPLDDEPRPLAAGAAGANTTAPPTTKAVVGDDTFPLYLVEEEGLVAVDRPVEPDAGLEAKLRTLLAGPTEDDLGLGRSSAIPARTRLLRTQLSGPTLTIELTPEINQIEGGNQKLAYAQLVFTAMDASAQAAEVRFVVEGKSVAVPTDSGNIAVVDKEDYRGVAPD